MAGFSDEQVEAAMRSWYSERWLEGARPDELREARSSMHRSLVAAQAVAPEAPDFLDEMEAELVQQDEPEGVCAFPNCSCTENGCPGVGGEPCRGCGVPTGVGAYHHIGCRTPEPNPVPVQQDEPEGVPPDVAPLPRSRPPRSHRDDESLRRLEARHPSVRFPPTTPLLQDGWCDGSGRLPDPSEHWSKNTRKCPSCDGRGCNVPVQQEPEERCDHDWIVETRTASIKVCQSCGMEQAKNMDDAVVGLCAAVPSVGLRDRVACELANLEYERSGRPCETEDFYADADRVLSVLHEAGTQDSWATFGDDMTLQREVVALNVQLVDLAESLQKAVERHQSNLRFRAEQLQNKAEAGTQEDELAKFIDNLQFVLPNLNDLWLPGGDTEKISVGDGKILADLWRKHGWVIFAALAAVQRDQDPDWYLNFSGKQPTTDEQRARFHAAVAEILDPRSFDDDQGEPWTVADEFELHDCPRVARARAAAPAVSGSPDTKEDER